MSVLAAHHSGRITGSYATRAGETVWLIAWDDRQARPPIALANDDAMFMEGDRVRLDGRHLVREHQGRRA